MVVLQMLSQEGVGRTRGFEVCFCELQSSWVWRGTTRTPNRAVTARTMCTYLHKTLPCVPTVLSVCDTFQQVDEMGSTEPQGLAGTPGGMAFCFPTFTSAPRAVFLSFNYPDDSCSVSRCFYISFLSQTTAGTAGNVKIAVEKQGDANPMPDSPTDCACLCRMEVFTRLVSGANEI